MAIVQRSDNIFALESSPDTVGPEIISILKAAADASPLKRARLCLHRGDDEPVHEMLIVLASAVYIRPHRHWNKPESFHLLEGEASAIFFNDNGDVTQEIRLGRNADQAFIYRVSHPIFHTQLVWSPHVVFYEVTKGPFFREETEFAAWAPEEGSPATEEFWRELRRRFAR